MTANVKLNNTKEVIVTREGFETIRRRIFDSNSFVTVTNKKGGKIVLNKRSIESIIESGERKQQNGK
jgi:hypothetical protein